MPPGLAGGNVDVVEADAEPAHGAEPSGPVGQRAADLAAVPDHQGACIHDEAGQLLGAVNQAGVVAGVQACEAVADRRLVHELGNDDVWHENSLGMGRHAAPKLVRHRASCRRAVHALR